MDRLFTYNYVILGSLGLLLILVAVCAARAETSVDSKDCGMHAGKQGYHHSFSDAHQWAKKFDDPARDKWQKPDEVIKALNIGAHDKVADIGAGTGYFSLRIAKVYPHATIYAADIEPDMVAYLKQMSKKYDLPNHVPLKVSASKPTFPSKVNLIMVVNTYHHIDERITYFSALKKQFLPNGRLAIIDFTTDSPEGPPPQHRISKADLQEEMKKAGYALDQEVSVLPYQYFLIFKPEQAPS